MIKQELVKVFLQKKDTYYILGLHYDENSSDIRLNSLDADEILNHVADCIESTLTFSKVDKIALATGFSRLIYSECEKYAERSLAQREGTNIFELVSLDYEYALLHDVEYVELLLQDYFGV